MNLSKLAPFAIAISTVLPASAAEPVLAVQGAAMRESLVTQLVEKLPASAGFPFRLTVRDASDQPQPNALVVLRWDGGSAEARTTAEGVLAFSATPAALATVSAETEDGLTPHFDAFQPTSIRVSTSAEPGPDVRITESADTAAAFEQLERDGLIVRYAPDDETLAGAVMEELVAIRSFLTEEIGLDLIDRPFGVTLSTGANDSVASLAVPMPREQWRDRSGTARWVTVHEWAEVSLTEFLDYQGDPAVRWVGDGLAEYASLAYTSSANPSEARGRLQQHCDALEELRDAGVESVSLERFVARATDADKGRIGSDPVEPLRYALAMFRFTECERAAPGSVAQIVGRIQSGELRTAAEIETAIGGASELLSQESGLDELERRLIEAQHSITE